MVITLQDGPLLSVLVVSYRTRDLTLACLRSLFRETHGMSFEVLVVDNASDDGSAAAIAEAFPDVQLVALEKNVGFAAANNIAAGRAQGEYLLLLNPDTEVHDEAIQRMMEFARTRAAAGIWGGRTLFPDGRLNPGSCWAAPTVWSTFLLALGLSNRFRSLNPEALGRWNRDSEREVEIVSGCFLLIDASLWRRLGGFDPAFFMYGEDADLCLRARRLGARPTITPRAEIMHIGGASERVRAGKMVRLFRAKAQLFARYWSPLRGRIGVRLLDLWALLRYLAFAVLGRISRSRREQLLQWRSVWRAREEWHRAFDEMRLSQAVRGSDDS